MTATIDMVDSMTMIEPDGNSAPAAKRLSTEELAAELLPRADGDPVRLVGPGSLLDDLTKRVLEAAFEPEKTEHVGYEPYDPAGHHSGNSRNVTRSKTVITDIGPIEIDVPRDRVGSFEPVMVSKGKRRLGGVDQMVLSLSAEGLTHREISADLEEIYGAWVSKETVTRITDGVLEDLDSVSQCEHQQRSPREQGQCFPGGAAVVTPTPGTNTVPMSGCDEAVLPNAPRLITSIS